MQRAARWIGILPNDTRLRRVASCYVRLVNLAEIIDLLGALNSAASHRRKLTADIGIL